jgi:RNA polymerase sigma-70 factor (ECF subfamily)
VSGSGARIQRVREFHELVKAHQGRIYSLAFRIVADSGMAEEIAQDAFLQLHGSLDRIESEEHALAWLRRTRVHRATDALRRRAKRVEFMAEEFEDGRDVSGLNDVSRGFNALANRVEQLVATLPEMQRVIVLLRYQEDLLPEEIATALGLPVATVKSHLQRGLQLLRTKSERTLKEFSRVRT